MTHRDCSFTLCVCLVRSLSLSGSANHFGWWQDKKKKNLFDFSANLIQVHTEWVVGFLNHFIKEIMATFLICECLSLRIVLSEQFQWNCINSSKISHKLCEKWFRTPFFFFAVHSSLFGAFKRMIFIYETLFLLLLVFFLIFHTLLNIFCKIKA